MLLSVVWIAALWLCHYADAGVPSTCKKPGMVVLSFDQGPGATTGKVLDVLSRRNIPAIFHVSPDLFRNATWRGYVQRAAYEGHSIGIFMPDIAVAGSAPSSAGQDGESNEESDEYDIALYQRLARASNWITSVTGRPPRHVRFGKKNVSPNTRRLAESLGLQVTRPRFEIRDESNKMDVIWNSINRAFNGTDPAQHSFIIKLRDIMPNMAASLDKFIDYVEAKGFRFVPMELCQPIPERLIHFKSAYTAASASHNVIGKAKTNGAVGTVPSKVLLLALVIVVMAMNI